MRELLKALGEQKENCLLFGLLAIGLFGLTAMGRIEAMLYFGLGAILVLCFRPK